VILPPCCRGRLSWRHPCRHPWLDRGSGGAARAGRARAWRRGSAGPWLLGGRLLPRAAPGALRRHLVRRAHGVAAILHTTIGCHPTHYHWLPSYALPSYALPPHTLPSYTFLSYTLPSYILPFAASPWDFYGDLLPFAAVFHGNGSIALGRSAPIAAC